MTQGKYQCGCWGYCCEGLSGIEPSFRPLSFTDFIRNSERHTLLHPTAPASSSLSCLILNAAGMCSVSLYLSTASPTHARTPPTYFLAFFLCCLSVIFFPCHLHFFFFISLSFSVKMAGSQTGLWFCIIRRQGQASPRQRGHSCGGVGRAAKWTCHGTTLVSWYHKTVQRLFT